MKNENSELVYPLLSRYSGWGGGDDGAHQAGFYTLFAADNEPHAIDCYRLNHVNNPIFNADLSTLTAIKLKELAQIPKGMDGCVVITSAPCQGASTAGKFEILHPLNKLLLNEPFHISKLNPAAFVFENVKGLTQGRMRALHGMLMKEIEKWLPNYHVWECVLNAGYYGVPQSRERYILMGFRKDLGVDPVFPKPNTANISVIADIIPDASGLAFGYGYKKFRPAKCVAPTLTRTENLKKVVNGEHIRLVEPEILGIGGFRKNWKYIGTCAKVYARTGNSIMPPFAKAIFTEIYKQLQKAGVPTYTVDALNQITNKTVPQSLIYNV